MNVKNHIDVSKLQRALNDIPECVTTFLLEIGVPTHIKGYKYLASAITICAKDPNILDAITKELYPAIADLYDTTASRVERSFRHAITSAFDRCDPDILHSFIGNTLHLRKDKLTNSEFISMAAMKLRRQILESV